MLSPISNHQSHSQRRKRQNQHPQRRLELPLCHSVDKQITADFADEGFQSELRLAGSKEVEREFGPDEKVEAADVHQQM